MGIHERKTSLRDAAARLEAAGFHYPDDTERQRAKTAIRLSMVDHIPDNTIRRKILGWIWVRDGVEVSTSLLSDPQIKAMRNWLQILPTGLKGEFTISQIAADELKAMANMVQGILPERPVQISQGKDPQAGAMVQAAIQMGGEIRKKDDEIAKKETDYDPYFRCD